VSISLVAAWEIFACLCNGGTLVIPGSGAHEEALEKVAGIASSLRSQADFRIQLDVLICTPAFLSRYRPESYPILKRVAVVGNASAALEAIWRPRTCWSHYRPDVLGRSGYLIPPARSTRRPSYSYRIKAACRLLSPSSGMDALKRRLEFAWLLLFRYSEVESRLGKWRADGRLG